MGRQVTWRQGAAQRRDERNIKSDDSSKSIPSSKDTKKWCQGKVGKEHIPKVFPMAFSLFKEKDGYYSLCCLVCGRSIASYFPMLRNEKKRPKPDWVIEYERKKAAGEAG